MAREKSTRLLEKREKLLALKDYAISSSLQVEDELLEAIHAASRLVEEDAAASEAALDKSISKLTALTFPVTINNIAHGPDEESRAYRRFKIVLLVLGGLLMPSLIVAGAVANAHPNHSDYLNPLIAILLGCLGAVVYAFFYVLRVIPQQAFNADDEYANYARLMLGGLLGLIVYFGLAREQFEQIFGDAAIPTGNADVSELYLWIMLPFLVGYSTSLALGLLNKLIVAFELVLGVEDPRDPSLRRKKR